MNLRCVLSWLMIGFAGLLVCSQTVAVFHLLDHQGEGFDFPRRYAVESSIENFGLALIVLVIAILVSRSSASAAAWAAFAVALVALWLMVGRELWLHYFELPRKYPGFADTHSYFKGKFWMFTPRFLWHLILPVTVMLSGVHVFSSRTRKGDAEPGAPPNGGAAPAAGSSGVAEEPPSVS